MMSFPIQFIRVNENGIFDITVLCTFANCMTLVGMENEFSSTLIGFEQL